MIVKRDVKEYKVLKSSNIFIYYIVHCRKYTTNPCRIMSS